MASKLTIEPMITDAKKWAAFEEEAIRADKPDFRRNMRLVEAMYREAAALGAFPPADLLEGIDVDIRIARVVNGVPPHS
ncbi:MAG: hypothetical protein HY896_13100 [Deltaproteobacteria bacterium]|nr:hypothetical protein [Deltaproteobacteria bacterium]